jgi:hypothetical protein
MDLICGKCAEPTDNDCLHDLVADGMYDTYSDAAAAFRQKGCEALGEKHNPATLNSYRALAADAMFDLLGDDMDGAAAMMDDFDYLGMFND